MASFITPDKCRKCGFPLEWTAGDAVLGVATGLISVAFKANEVRERCPDDYNLCERCGKKQERDRRSSLYPHDL